MSNDFKFFETPCIFKLLVEHFNHKYIPNSLPLHLQTKSTGKEQTPWYLLLIDIFLLCCAQCFINVLSSSMKGYHAAVFITGDL